MCGSYPHWLMVTQRGALNLHPMFIDGPITSFTAFHNVNCPHGFLYFSAEVGTCACMCLYVCVFVLCVNWCDLPCPPRASFVSPSCHLTCRTTPPGRRARSPPMPPRTPSPTTWRARHMSWSPQSRSPSRTCPNERTLRSWRPWREVCALRGCFWKHVPNGVLLLFSDERFVYPMEDKFVMQLYAPAAWQPIPNTRYVPIQSRHVRIPFQSKCNATPIQFKFLLCSDVVVVLSQFHSKWNGIEL